MKKKPVITIIGAASITFGSKVLTDVVNHPQLDGCTLRFVDIDEQHLEIYTGIARLVEQRIDHSITIESGTDRRQMLPGSDFIMISVETSRYDRWEEDYLIPIDLGSKQVYAELGGPGGMFHSFRQVPLHLEIAHDIAELCPGAMVTVESNPLNRICLAMERYADIEQIVGLCHGVELSSNTILPRTLDIPGEQIEVTAAGTNHHAWILDMWHRTTGEDLYPQFRKRIGNVEADRERFCMKLFEVFGYYPAPGDTHVGEYYSFAAEYVPIDRERFRRRKRNDKDRWQYLQRVVAGEAELDTYGRDESERPEELRLDDIMRPRRWVDTLGFPIFAAIVAAEPKRMPAVNMVNVGQIGNLPRGYFVETPGIADGSGLRPMAVGDLPSPPVVFNRRDIDQTELVVEAAVHGDRRLALQAMLVDPVSDSVSRSEKILDTMLKKQADSLPQFA